MGRWNCVSRALLTLALALFVFWVAVSVLVGLVGESGTLLVLASASVCAHHYCQSLRRGRRASAPIRSSLERERVDAIASEGRSRGLHTKE